MHTVRCADPCLPLSRLFSRLWAATMMPALLCPADFQRRLAALLTGVFAQRRAPEAADSAGSGYKVFFGVFHRQDCTPVLGNPGLPDVARISVMQ